jgi:hypothetical protein
VPSQAAESRLSVAERAESLARCREPRAETFEFGDCFLAVFRFQSFNRVLYYGYAPAAFEQSLYGKAHAIFRHDAEDYKLGLSSESVDEPVGVPAFENIQRLFFQQDLLIVR